MRYFHEKKKSISIFVSLPGKQMCYYAKYDTQCYGSPNINCVLYHNSVHGVQEGFLHYVLYQIDHNAVPVLQYCCLHYVLYQIDHKVVPGLHEWLLHNVSLFRTTTTINVLDIIIYCGNNICKNSSKR